VKSVAILGMTAILTTAGAAHAGDASGFFEGKRGFSMKVAAGGSFRRLYTIPIGAADLSLAFGSQTRSGGWYGGAGLLLGSTEHGLDVTQLRFGASWEAPIDRLHLGLSIRASITMIDRASNGGTLIADGYGGTFFLSYDVVSKPNYALYAVLEPSADALNGNDSPVLLGGTLGVGARFF
jgi:hypothetical protein